MAVTIGVFVSLLIFAWIAILVAGILCAMGAGDIKSSSIYATNAKAQQAHTYLTAGACIGIITFVALTIVLGAAWFAGVLTTVDIKDLYRNTVTLEDVKTLKSDLSKWNHLHSVQLGLLISLIILLGLSITTAIFAAMAAGSLSNVPSGTTNHAYSNAFIASIIAFLSVGFILPAIFLFFGFKSTVDSDVKEAKSEIESAEKRTEPNSTTSTPSNPSPSNPSPPNKPSRSKS